MPDLARRCCSRRSLLLAAVYFFFAVGGTLLPSPLAAADPPEQGEPGKHVRLTIDFGDGVQKVFTSLPYQDKMTVLDLMQAAARHQRGIKFKHRGSGSIALLTEIDGQKNEGGAGRNWIFSVNGREADRSFGLSAPMPGDAVLWEFKTYR